MSKFNKSTGWFWIPFVIVLFTEKMLAKAKERFRVATDNMGTEALSEPGKYVMYQNDRPIGENTEMVLVRKVIIEDNNSLSFRGFGRDESSNFESGIVFTAANAELLAQVTFEFDNKMTTEEMFQAAILKQIYPALNPGKTKWNAAFTSALNHFCNEGKLFKNGERFVDLNGNEVNPSNVEQWLTTNCHGSLLTRILGLRQPKVNVDNRKNAKQATSQTETTLPVVLNAEDWA